MVLDGAMGSMLIDQGLEPGTPPESWNVTHPDKIKNVHKKYFEAGSDVVLTNTFGGSRLKLSKHSHGTHTEKYNRKAVQIAKEVCPKDGYVAGDIGPSGQFLPPVGTATIEDFEQNFLEQAKNLEDSGVDLFFIETMVDVKEAEAAVKAVRKTSTKPIFASMTYKKTKRGFFTIMGNTIEQCISVLTEASADVIGANCTISSDEMIDLIPLIFNSTDLNIIAKPNAGKPQLIEGETVYLSNPTEFANDISQMIQHGAKVVGGCCGSNPAFIKEITKQVKRVT